LPLVSGDEHLRTWSWRLVPKGQNLRWVSKRPELGRDRGWGRS
jgi:hypothetical protein